MRLQLACLLVFAACGSSSSSTTDAPSGGGGGGGNADAHVFNDAPPNVPAMITISGAASEQGLGGATPLAGCTVAAYKASDDNTVIAMATTDAQGKFSLTVPTGGAPFDGYLKGSKSGYTNNYLFSTAPLIADYTTADLNMITTGNFGTLSSFAQGNQMAGKGVIGLDVLDASGMGIAGATVSSNPACNPYRYNGSNGFPSSSATSTSSDGIAFMFNAAPGAITVSATKTGVTFHSHVVKAFPDSLTTTAIQP